MYKGRRNNLKIAEEEEEQKCTHIQNNKEKHFS